MHSKFTASALGCSEETLFISFSKGVTGILRDRTCLEKDTNECSGSATSCCRTSCVSVQPCTPKVLPNTETFLHSRVFFVTCVVPALCQIMYSLSVCSDGTTSAAPRSFRQNRPPARTLSLTERGACRSWPMPAYCANERLGYKNDHVSWSHLLVGQLFGKKKTNKKKAAKMVKKKKKRQPEQTEGLW